MGDVEKLSEVITTEVLEVVLGGMTLLLDAATMPLENVLLAPEEEVMSVTAVPVPGVAM